MDANLETFEGRQKAESLFSKKFIEYLSNKKSFTSNTLANQRLPENLGLMSLEKGQTVTASSDDTITSECSRKSLSKRKRKKLKDRPSLRAVEFNYNLRSRLTQCSLIKEAEEIATPEELKQLLVNMSILLQEVKDSSSSFENLYNLISKITMLVTEFNRRPIKRVQEESKNEYTKNLHACRKKMLAILHEYKNNHIYDPDNELRECKRLQKELSMKNNKIADLKKRLSVFETKLDMRNKDINERVKNSLLYNEQLKRNVKFNLNRIKKYKKLVIEKEWTKHRMENYMSHLKTKISRVDVSDSESYEWLSSSPEVSVRDEIWSKELKTPKEKNFKKKKGKAKSSDGDA